MLIYYTDHFVLPLPPGHRFPMRKYAALRERVAAVAGDRMRVPAAATDAELARVHDAAYVAAVVQRHARRAGACGASAFRGRRRWSSARAARPARRSPRAAARSTPAAASTSPAARITRIATSARAFACSTTPRSRRARCRPKGSCARVLIVDLDVHQGDGTAAIFAGDDERVHLLDARAQQLSVPQAALRPRRRARRRHRRRAVPRDARASRCRARSTARGPTSRSISPAPTRSQAIASAGSR